MGMTIEDIKHCLLCMIDCEVCEECNLYGTTGTDHCEKDCVDGALNIINTYERLRDNYNERLKADMAAMLEDLRLRADETQGHKYNSDFWDGFFTYDDIIRAEINTLKGE